MSLSSAYTPNTPQPTDQINNTQQPIQGNFQDIYDLLAINHIPFNTVDTFGRHAYVNYVNQGSDPSTLSGEIALYSKSVENNTSKTELFYRYPSNGQIVQLTNASSTSAGSTTQSRGGYFINDNTQTSIGPSVAYGYFQYLSNNILFMSFCLSSFSTSTTSVEPSPDGGFYVYFPQGNYSSPSGTITVPSFTQTPFNIQIAATTNSGVQGKDGYYATTSVRLSDTTRCTIATSSGSPTNFYPITITLIGV